MSGYSNSFDAALTEALLLQRRYAELIKSAAVAGEPMLREHANSDDYPIRTRYPNRAAYRRAVSQWRSKHG